MLILCNVYLHFTFVFKNKVSVVSVCLNRVSLFKRSQSVACVVAAKVTGICTGVTSAG